MAEVKAVLARIPLPLNLRIAVIKLVSATLVLGTGMPLGREGPTVQIGAALANQLSNWVPTSPEHRRQLIAAGAGAGLAAAFNAPIAGVLFVVEELLQDVSGLTLGTAILASFIAAVISRLYGNQGLDLDLQLAVFKTTFFAPEIPFYLILAILSGLLGNLFNQSVLASLAVNDKILHWRLPWRLGLAGLISGIAISLLPIDFRDNAGLREVLLTGEADWLFAAITLLVQFVLIVLCSGSGAPAGLLVPTLVLGAALGYLVGDGEHTLFKMGVATTYAHVGMAGFFAAVSKVPITAVVIVFEMTTDFNLVLPLMIVSVVAYLVAEKLDHRSLYDLLLERKGIFIKKEPSNQGILSEICAADVMQRHVETLSDHISIDQAIQTFSRSHHRHFPVMQNGQVVGILTQTDLGSREQQPLTPNATIRQIMTPEPITVSPIASLAHVLHLLNHHRINCLPVTEGRRLLGIITRSDIIRVEAERLASPTPRMTDVESEPSYIIYQNRSPSLGKGRLLVPLSHPQTAPALMEIAAAIAKERDYDLECLQVIVVPLGRANSETAVQTTASHHLFQQSKQLGKDWQICIHTEIRVAHDVTRAILDVVKEKHIDLILMGWKVKPLASGGVFSRVVDQVIHQATCEVVLVRLNHKRSFNRWLVPLAGGPNSSEAVKLLPGLTQLSPSPEIKLCQIFQPSGSTPDATYLESAAKFLHTRVNGDVVATGIQANSVSESIIEYAENDHSDVIVLGASRENLLQQTIHGNIPAAIARKSSCTLILVRTAIA
jgi:CIC family chloride channel protein